MRSFLSLAIELIADRNLDVEQLSSSDYASSDVFLKGTEKEILAYLSCALV